MYLASGSPAHRFMRSRVTALIDQTDPTLAKEIRDKRLGRSQTSIPYTCNTRGIRFIQANGAIVRLACSWHAHIGQGAIIQIAITGTRGGAHWTNIDGSFYDFKLDLIHGTNRERLSGRDESDDWGPKALQAWIEQLRVSNRFDPEADEIIRSAALIEEVYRA